MSITYPPTTELLKKHGRKKYKKLGVTYSRAYKDAVASGDKNSAYAVRLALLRLEGWI